MKVDPGRLIFPALRWRPESGFGHEDSAIAAALALGVGGFIVFGGTAATVQALTADLVRRAGRPLLIAADLERGAGQQVQDLTEFPPPPALAAMNDPEVIRWAAAVTAWEARSVGINWVLAPVADLDFPENPIIQTRSFGSDPEAVAEAVGEWIRGCQAGGAMACAKHYPGHGRTDTDSHSGLPVVDAPAEVLRQEDGRPFAKAVQAAVSSIITAHVAYPALDPTGLPATFSPVILNHLRRGLGYDGLIVTDALIMEGAIPGHGEADAGVQALWAGCDVLLYPSRPAEMRRAIERAMIDGSLPMTRVAGAGRRYQRALETVPAAPSEAPTSRYGSSAELADALLARGFIRGDPPALGGSVELQVVDDDIGGPYPPVSSEYVEGTMAASGLAQATGGARVVLAFCEPRAWKNRAGFGAESRQALESLAPGAALVVLFGHPRLLAEIPGSAPVLLAWHRQRLMQEAVGRWLLGK